MIELLTVDMREFSLEREISKRNKVNTPNIFFSFVFPSLLLHFYFCFFLLLFICDLLLVFLITYRPRQHRNIHPKLLLWKSIIQPYTKIRMHYKQKLTNKMKSSKSCNFQLINCPLQKK